MAKDPLYKVGDIVNDSSVPSEMLMSIDPPDGNIDLMHRLIMRSLNSMFGHRSSMNKFGMHTKAELKKGDRVCIIGGRFLGLHGTMVSIWPDNTTERICAVRLDGEDGLRGFIESYVEHEPENVKDQ